MFSFMTKDIPIGHVGIYFQLLTLTRLVLFQCTDCTVGEKILGLKG